MIKMTVKVFNTAKPLAGFHGNQILLATRNANNSTHAAPFSSSARLPKNQTISTPYYSNAYPVFVSKDNSAIFGKFRPTIAAATVTGQSLFIIGLNFLKMEKKK